MSDVAGLDAGDDSKINLISKEGTKYPVSKQAVVSQSNLVKKALEDDENATDVELTHIEGHIVERIIGYLEYHVSNPPKEIKKPLPTPDLASLVDEFDAKFIDTDQEIMFLTLVAANYMDIQSLLNLMCAKVASMMKDKNPKQIRETFQISEDFTKEEEEEIRTTYKDLLEA